MDCCLQLLHWFVCVVNPYQLYGWPVNSASSFPFLHDSCERERVGICDSGVWRSQSHFMEGSVQEYLHRTIPLPWWRCSALLSDSVKCQQSHRMSAPDWLKHSTLPSCRYLVLNSACPQDGWLISSQFFLITRHLGSCFNRHHAYGFTWFAIALHAPTTCQLWFSRFMYWNPLHSYVSQWAIFWGHYLVTARSLRSRQQITSPVLNNIKCKGKFVLTSNRWLGRVGPKFGSQMQKGLPPLR